MLHVPYRRCQVDSQHSPSPKWANRRHIHADPAARRIQYNFARPTTCLRVFNIICPASPSTHNHLRDQILSFSDLFLEEDASQKIDVLWSCQKRIETTDAHEGFA